MLGYIIKRIGQAVVVLLLVTFIVFMIMQAMPGDPVRIYLGDGASLEQIEHYTRLFGFDKPVVVQYFKWLSGFFRGEMGTSIVYTKDVAAILPTRVTATLSLSIPSFCLSIALGIALGVLAAFRRGKWLDSLISAVANIGLATPQFFFGILFMYVLALKLGWLPVQGYTPLREDFALGIKKLIMPVIVLSLGQAAVFARQTRSAMLEVIGQDYMRTARSKGLKERVILLRHGLHNAIIPLITLMGMSLGRIIGGSVIIENLFSIPGMGQLLITAINSKDYFIVQSIVLIIALFVVACNLLVDILYGVLDPRIRVA